MTQSTLTTAPPAAAVRLGGPWAWWGVVAGVLGFVATTATVISSNDKPVGTPAVNHVSTATAHVGGALGYLTVAALLVVAAAWRSRVTAVRPTSLAARVVGDGLTASAAALSLGYGWKLALALYSPGGFNDGQFGAGGRFVYYVLTDFGPFIGWLGVCVAAGAMAWLGLRERCVSLWIGIVSVLPVIAVAVMSLLLEVAGYPGIVGPVWMVVAFAGLALSRRAAV